MFVRKGRLLAGLAAGAVLAVAGTHKIIASTHPTRSISLYNIHTKETTTVQYKKDGKHVATAMDKINWALRDWRKDEQTTIDPQLIDLLWEIHNELGSAQPIHVISAYRSRGTNEMLRTSVGGQASESRHILGKAIDVHFPDVPLKNLRYSALIRERGGVGYYPTSAIPFVHVDTDRVRHWPRLPRYELALLFPNGHTQHQPADGGPITSEDVRVAQSQHRDLAVQVAAFHGDRKSVKPAITIAQNTPTPATAARQPTAQQVALLTPPAEQPQLVEAPRLIDRPTPLIARPSADERRKLSDLAAMASLAPALPQLIAGPAPAVRRSSESSRVAAIDQKGGATLSDLNTGWGTGFVQAPAFDEEHPEELSYRPFPLAPFMTQTASADDPALVQLVHPDAAKTFELLDQAGSMPPMRLLPAQQAAQLMLAQQFKGEAVNLRTAGLASALPAGGGRKVSTTSR